MPATLLGGELEQVLYNGEMDAAYRDGVLYWQAIQWIDELEHEDVPSHYDIRDTGQASQPSINLGDGYDGTHRLSLPPNNPNSIYTSSNQYGNQTSHVDHYYPTGEIFECFFEPTTWSSSIVLRFYTGGSGPDLSDGQLSIHFDGTDYWRLEFRDSSGWDYYGSIQNGAPEDGGFTIQSDTWHRLVVDKSNWPDVSAHLWDADSGSHISTLESDGGTGSPNNDGLGWWWNGDTGLGVSKMNLIDSDDI